MYPNRGGKVTRTKTCLIDSDFAELDVDNAMENVEGDAETQGRNTAEQITTAGDTVNTASIDVSAVGPSNVSTADPSTSTAGDIFKDEMMTIADTLVAIRSTRPRTTLVVIHDVEEEPRRATPIPIVQSQDKGKGKMVEPEPTPKNPIKAQIQRDAEIAQRLFEEEQAQFEREQRIARERAAEQEAKDAALIKQMEDIQARMDADELLAERLQQEEREQFTIEEKSRMLVEMIAERKRFFAHQRAEQIRNKPTNQKDVLKGSRSGSNDFVLWIMEVVKTIESADGSSKNYKIFSEMLDDFDGQYVLDLYRLVKEIFETASPEGYDRLRWGDLITVFESRINKYPSEEEMVPFIKELGCVSGKSTDLDRLRPSRASILWGMFYQKNVGYVALLWEDFMFQADNREISFTHDTLLGTLKFVSKTKDYQKYGALIPEEMINQAIKDSKEYKTYLKFASGKFTPMNTRNLSWAKNLNREAAKTAKKTTRANKLYTMQTTSVVIRDTPGVSVSKKKAPAKVNKGMDLLSDVALLSDG
ncbi:hypothetical protein Tco_0085780 [Tanacetum coccineum]